MTRRSFFTKLFSGIVAGVGAMLWKPKPPQWEGIVSSDGIRTIRYTRNQWGAWCGDVLRPMTHEQVRQMLCTANRLAPRSITVT